MAAWISIPDPLPLFLSQTEREMENSFVLRKDNGFFFSFLFLHFDCEQANHLWLILYQGFFSFRWRKPWCYLSVKLVKTGEEQCWGLWQLTSLVPTLSFVFLMLLSIFPCVCVFVYVSETMVRPSSYVAALCKYVTYLLFYISFSYLILLKNKIHTKLCPTWKLPYLKKNRTFKSQNVDLLFIVFLCSGCGIATLIFQCTLLT